MILKPTYEDVKIIGFFLGKVMIAIGLAMLVPLGLALVMLEKNPLLDFLISAEITFVFGLFFQRVFRTERSMQWMHGMVIVSLSWLIGMILCAFPLWLSHHWHSYLDACFDAMSGLTTSGFTLAQDLDHMSYSHNLWRHLIMFFGGQGIVIVALSLFVQGFSGGFTMYVGEGREEKILPNVRETSRFIWLVSLTYLVLGTLALWLTGVCIGMRPFNALFHGACIFMAAFDTGGFTPQSQSILYYHSFAYEIITVVIMTVGSLNFRLHYFLWNGRRREIAWNIETRTLFITVMATFLIAAVGLLHQELYPHAAVLFRKGFYHIISAHTTTGFSTIYTPQFDAWGGTALFGMMIAMGLGGAVCSTTGAIKMIRIGIIYKAFVQDIKRIIMPERAVVIQKFHHMRDTLLEDKQVRAAMLITLGYISLYLFGTLIGVLLGYPFQQALFESTSAAANVGLSSGIIAVNMPVVLKVTYIFQMWAGRLEFMSILTLVGILIAVLRGKR